MVPINVPPLCSKKVNLGVVSEGILPIISDCLMKRVIEVSMIQWCERVPKVRV